MTIGHYCFFLIYFEDKLLHHPIYLYLTYGTSSNSSFYLNTNNIDYDLILNIDILEHIITHYFNRLRRFFDFEDVNKFFNERNSFIPFNLDEILSSIFYLSANQLKLIFERMGQDLQYYSKGFPDLLVYNEEQFFFVEVKSKDDKPSLKQIQLHKFLSNEVNLNILIFTIDKSQIQIDNIKEQYENSIDISRKQITSIKPMHHINEILLIPQSVEWFSCNIREYKFIKYPLMPSSGEGKIKYLLETNINIYNENTNEWEYENKDVEFLALMRTRPDSYEKCVVGEYTRLSASDYGGGRNFRELRKKISEKKYDLIYEKAKKLYFPNVFADFRPTTKQLDRNKKAKLMEEMNDYEEAIKLYEENVSEKTGSPTTYKRLISLYSKSEDYSRIIELMDIAIPIFIYLNDKKNTIFFLKTKFHTLFVDLPRYYEYHKFVTKDQNDYLYEHCCVDNPNEIIREKMRELKSKAHGVYSYSMDL